MNETDKTTKKNNWKRRHILCYELDNMEMHVAVSDM